MQIIRLNFCQEMEKGTPNNKFLGKKETDLLKVSHIRNYHLYLHFILFYALLQSKLSNPVTSHHHLHTDESQISISRHHFCPKFQTRTLLSSYECQIGIHNPKRLKMESNFFPLPYSQLTYSPPNVSIFTTNFYLLSLSSPNGPPPFFSLSLLMI